MTETLPFLKMHGAGNDFVLLNARDGLSLSGLERARLCDRHFGIGCDQLIEVHAPMAGRQTDVELRFYNSDGGQADACGNGTRAAAWWLMEQESRDSCLIEVSGRRLPVWREGDLVWVMMGSADFAPDAVPVVLAEEADLEDFFEVTTLGLVEMGVCSMGNPHLVLMATRTFTDEEVTTHGARLEKHPAFPESVNIGFLSLNGDDSRLRVWERGVGETLACGSGACAAFAVARRAGLIEAGAATLTLPGGRLQIAEKPEGLAMTGPVALVAEGHWYV